MAQDDVVSTAGDTTVGCVSRLDHSPTGDLGLARIAHHARSLCEGLIEIEMPLFNAKLVGCVGGTMAD